MMRSANKWTVWTENTLKHRPAEDRKRRTPLSPGSWYLRDPLRNAHGVGLNTSAPPIGPTKREQRPGTTPSRYRKMNLGRQLQLSRSNTQKSVPAQGSQDYNHQSRWTNSPAGKQKRRLRGKHQVPPSGLPTLLKPRCHRQPHRPRLPESALGTTHNQGDF